jgi:hypothetical protein
MLILTVSQTEIKPFVSKDGMRPAMKGVLIDFENSCFVATNGNVMLKHKISFNTDDLPANMPLKVVVPVEAFPKKKGDETIIRFTVKESSPDVKGDTYFFVDVMEVEEYGNRRNIVEKRIIKPIPEFFPNYRVVIPEPLPDKESEEWQDQYDRKVVQTIGVDWNFLKDISPFLINQGVGDVKITFNGQTGAMVLTSISNAYAEEWIVLLMPYKI